MTGDVNDITSIWPVLALAVVLGIPAFFSWLNSRSANIHARRGAEAAQVGAEAAQVSAVAAQVGADEAKRGADEIVHQSQPNSGQSLKDSLNRIESKVEDVQAEQSRVAERLAAVEARAKFFHPQEPEES